VGALGASYIFFLREERDRDVQCYDVQPMRSNISEFVRDVGDCVVVHGARIVTAPQTPKVLADG
jgi:hypothetical protein